MKRILFHNGTILTQNPKHPVVTALGISGHRIRYTGSNPEEWNTTPDEVVDLQGHTVLPGFNDAHIHLWKVGQLKTTIVDVREAESIPDLIDRMRQFADRHPDQPWIIARGYHEHRLAEQRHPDHTDLDSVSTERPVYLIRTCAHRAVANSAALARAGISGSTPDPSGGVIERRADGIPTGTLHETALFLVQRHLPPDPPHRFQEMILAGITHLHRYGITSITDPGVNPAIRQAYRQLADDRRLVMRCNVMILGPEDNRNSRNDLPEHTDSDHLRINTVKFFCDGALSGGTAALRGTYRSHQGSGVLRLDSNTLYTRARPYHDAGWRIATHAIGDAAIDSVLGACESLAPAKNSLSPRIEHCGLPDTRQIQRMKNRGIIAVPQTIFLQELGEGFRTHLHTNDLNRCYPVHSLLKAGLIVALSTDAPVVRDVSPLSGIKAAITRCDATGTPIAPHEAITIEEALHAYTLGGALASGDSAHRGSIEPGKQADLVILDRNPLHCPPHDLPAIRVQSTWVGGECVYSRR